MEVDAEETDINLKPDQLTQIQSNNSRIFQELIEEANTQKSGCSCFCTIRYLTTVYFILMGIGYILIQYAFILKYEFPLSCSGLVCQGQINNIHMQKPFIIEALSNTSAKLVGDISIEEIVLTNQNNSYYLQIAHQNELLEPNCYLNYRAKWAAGEISLIYDYEIVIKFHSSVPSPFFKQLSMIIRYNGRFKSNQALNMAIICLVFAAVMSFFNLFSGSIRSHQPSKKQPQKQHIHKIFLQEPSDISDLDKDLMFIRARAFKSITNELVQARSSQQQSEYSSLVS